MALTRVMNCVMRNNLGIFHKYSMVWYSMVRDDQVVIWSQAFRSIIRKQWITFIRQKSFMQHWRAFITNLSCGHYLRRRTVITIADIWLCLFQICSRTACFGRLFGSIWRNRIESKEGAEGKKIFNKWNRASVTSNYKGCPKVLVFHKKFFKIS